MSGFLKVATLTWAMSSKQLKMYFRASFDLIPVSNSCSSGVYKTQIFKNSTCVWFSHFILVKARTQRPECCHLATRGQTWVIYNRGTFQGRDATLVCGHPFNSDKARTQLSPWRMSDKKGRYHFCLKAICKWNASEANYSKTLEDESRVTGLTESLRGLSGYRSRLRGTKQIVVFKKIYKALIWAVRKLCCFATFIENAPRNSLYS